MKRMLAALVAAFCACPSLFAQGFGIWTSKDGVEPISHVPLFAIPRHELPTWLQAATFRADRVQVNAVVGWSTEASTATAGWSATAHWGITFLGVGFSGEIRNYEWRDLGTHIRVTLGVQF